MSNLHPAKWTTAVQIQYHLIQKWTRTAVLKVALVASGIFVVAVFNTRIPVLFGTTGPEGPIWKFTTFDAAKFGLVDLPGIMALVLTYILACGMGLLQPFGDWSGEAPRQRSFHWSLPVSRSGHDLARVAAGVLNVFSLTCLLVLVTVAGLMVGGNLACLGALTEVGWASLLLCPVILYLAGSVLCIACNHPARVMWALALGTVAPSTVFVLVQYTPGMAVFEFLLNGPISHTALLSRGFFSDLNPTLPSTSSTWWPAFAFWSVAVGVGVVLAAHRHREN